MPSPKQPEDDLIHNVLSEDASQSLYACLRCRSQKIKCDRMLTSCANCAKTSRVCSYPPGSCRLLGLTRVKLTVHKPGPKTGTHRRPPPSSSRTLSDHLVDVQNTAKRVKLGDNKRTSTSQPSPNSVIVRASSPHESEEITTSSTRGPLSPAKTDNPLLKLVLLDHVPNSTRTIEPKYCDSPIESFSRFQEACAGLGCTAQQGWDMLDVYFEYMTSFSLFHRPTFQRKLGDVTSLTHLQAFLSALFSYALRYKETIPSLKKSALEAKEMLEISSRLQMKCIEGCLDDDPPLHLLQSLLLVTFQKLIHGVRGRTWRMLGECIRIAYELRLHLIDVESIKGQSEISHDIEHETFILTEERRRVWWACYEMDIFASTIRKMPNAIDERLNCTRLPVSDEDWFRGFESRSCFLLPDATHRWKEVAASGNQSPQTWFILINSYMFDAFQMGAFPEVWQKRVGFHADQLPSKKKTSVPDLRKFLDFLENCLQCAQIALPEQLEWKERLLAFDGPSRAIDCARFSIHVMSQLARLMLCIWEVNRASMALQHSETDRGRSASFSPPTPTATAAQEQAWVKYIDAANLTARMVRNSAPYHLRFVNPLIANAIWISAASLVVAKLFAPHSFDSCQAQSNFDLLVVTLNKYEAFWEIPSVLKHKLQNLESTLRNIRQCTPGTEDATMVDGKSPIFSALDPVQQSHAQAHTSHLNNMHSQQAVDLSSNTVTDFSSQDWLAQDFFDFNAIPSLGPGPSRSITPFVFDPIFDGNVLSDTEFFNFNDLFAYPYQ